MFLHEIGGISWLKLWRCWLHSCGMFILLVEYGLVHRGDCINCETLFLFWSGFCTAESWVCRLSLYLACKPFLGLCTCTQTSWWCASVVAIRSLSPFTNRADRCSQTNSLDSWCATRISKTLDVVHRYALLVSNSDMCNALSNKAGAGQFMTDFLPLTAWSQMPPVSLSISCA